MIAGERHRQVTDEIIQLALGRWGREALEFMDPTVRDRILDRPRARELAQVDPAKPSLAEVRAEFGESLSDEELITRAYVDADAVETLRRAPPPKEEPIAASPIVSLIAALLKEEEKGLISIQKPGMSLTIGKDLSDRHGR